MEKEKVVAVVVMAVIIEIVVVIEVRKPGWYCSPLSSLPRMVLSDRHCLIS